MSNTYVIKNARLVAPPVFKDLGAHKVTECRVADNPMKRKDKNGKDIKSRFVTLKFWDFAADQANKLSQGDIIVVDGELSIETYTGKDGVEKDKDVMRVNSFVISKSETFYGREEAPAETETKTAPKSDLPF